MPTITLSIDLGSEDLEFKQYELSLDESVGNLKALVHRDFGVPITSQHVYFSNNELHEDAQKLAAAGVNDQDMIQITQYRGQQTQSQPVASGAASNVPTDQATIQQGIEDIRQNLLRQVAQNPQARAQFAAQSPELERALDDPVRFRQMLEEYRQRQAQQQGAYDAEADELDGNINEENQAKIMERIRLQRIREEADRAMEEHPELFGRVTMLYVQLEVNGHPVKAFVDSGAQATIISPSCAETCGITKSIDTRFAGIARGVGTAKILGRIHEAKIRIGDVDELPCAFTVMEGKDVDLLLGLDMLKRYQACIDLKQNKLILGGGSASVPFLGESEIPKNFEEAMDSEPTIEGPGGVAVGAESGALKPSTSNPASSSKAGGNFGGQGRTLGTPSSSSSKPAAASSSTAQQTPSRQQIPPRPAAPTPSVSQFPEASISMLTNMGASREQAIQLLRASNGNTEYAASMLFDM